jgi:hypothetical protein
MKLVRRRTLSGKSADVGACSVRPVAAHSKQAQAIASIPFGRFRATSRRPPSALQHHLGTRNAGLKTWFAAIHLKSS